MLERSQVQEIAKRFLDEIAFTMVEEQKLFKFMIEAGSTATRSYDDILELGHLVQHIAFNLAEYLLATFGKELRHSAMISALDVMVEIDEL